MSMTLIKGTFHVEGYSPDGDSVKFKANDSSLWRKLGGGTYTKRNWWGHTQLRIESIDALETHFKNEHQPRKWADAATDALLAFLGFREVVWDSGRGKVKKTAKDAIPGYILSRENDKFGRPISFVFTGETDQADGSTAFLDVPLLKKSLNYHLLAEGLVYPMFYKGLFSDLRDAMTEALQSARSNQKGLWQDDRSMGVIVENKRTITDESPIFPKLFRRLIAHLGQGGRVEDFMDYLKANQEGVLILSRQHFTHFDNVIEVKGKEIKLLYPPEDLVFLP